MRRRTLGVKKRTDHHDYPYDRYRIFLIGILHGWYAVHEYRAANSAQICHLHRHLQQNLLNLLRLRSPQRTRYISTIRKSLPTDWLKRYNLS